MPERGQVTPFQVGAALQQARRQGLLEPVETKQGDGTVAKSVPGPREAAPVVEHLNLRQHGPRSNDSPM